MKETYPGIRREAKAQAGEIQWGDEPFFCSDHQDRTFYGKRGKTPGFQEPVSDLAATWSPHSPTRES